MCDSVVAVGDETAGGTTLFAKNSDRKRDECQPLLQFAEAVHPPGAMLRCTHIEIPQVAETYRVLGHSPWWMWGFEHGVNEHAVAVGAVDFATGADLDPRRRRVGRRPSSCSSWAWLRTGQCRTSGARRRAAPRRGSAASNLCGFCLAAAGSVHCATGGMHAGCEGS